MSSAPGEKKKKGPLFWVLTGGALFLVLLFGGLLVVAYSAKRDLQRRMAVSQGDELIRTMRVMCIGSNADNEIVDEDPVAFAVHLRNKKTGKESRCSMDPATKQIKTLPFELEDPAKAPGK